MKIEYLESEGFFTSNGFFKIWNYSSGKNFPIFGQYFVPTLAISDNDTHKSGARKAFQDRLDKAIEAVKNHKKQQGLDFSNL